MFTLYLPECGAPTVGFWLKHIVLLIVHTGCALKRAALKVTWQEKNKGKVKAEHVWFVFQRARRPKFPSLMNPTLEKSTLRADEMISDTFISRSFLQSIHYHYRQPVWPIMSALKSIKPQWISWGRENEQTVCLNLWQRSQCLFRQIALLNSVMKPHNSLWLGKSVEPQIHLKDFAA